MAGDGYRPKGPALDPSAIVVPFGGSGVARPDRPGPPSQEPPSWGAVPVWVPTPGLRWVQEGGTAMLEQEWLERVSGKTEWRPVPKAER
jgi:hypothetical protein